MDLISENLKGVPTPSDPTSENLGGGGWVPDSRSPLWNRACPMKIAWIGDRRESRIFFPGGGGGGVTAPVKKDSP